MGYAKLKTTTTPLLKGGDYGGKVSSSSRHVGLSVHDVWPANVGPDVAQRLSNVGRWANNVGCTDIHTISADVTYVVLTSAQCCRI